MRWKRLKKGREIFSSCMFAHCLTTLLCLSCAWGVIIISYNQQVRYANTSITPIQLLTDYSHWDKGLLDWNVALREIGATDQHLLNYRDIHGGYFEISKGELISLCEMRWEISGDEVRYLSSLLRIWVWVVLIRTGTFSLFQNPGLPEGSAGGRQTGERDRGDSPHHSQRGPAQCVLYLTR